MSANNTANHYCISTTAEDDKSLLEVGHRPVPAPGLWSHYDAPSVYGAVEGAGLDVPEGREPAEDVLDR